MHYGLCENGECASISFREMRSFWSAPRVLFHIPPDEGNEGSVNEVVQ